VGGLLTNFKHCKGFQKSCVETFNHASKKCLFLHNRGSYGKFHKKNVFFIETFPYKGAKD
jgi:hypothetical protein